MQVKAGRQGIGNPQAERCLESMRILRFLAATGSESFKISPPLYVTFTCPLTPASHESHHLGGHFFYCLRPAIEAHGLAAGSHRGGG